ncbi:MAG TPA: hypothetical protein VLA12_01825 [Planctomycetaceae bacterium]|nr:hypothetical protein [Planctomycetaceae bacterium]
MGDAISVRKIGRLRCAVFDPPGIDPDQLDLVAIFCHGFGAPGDDLVPFGPHLASLLGPVSPAIRYYFPEAPLSLESVGMPGGRAWWMLDLQQLQLAAEGKLTRDQRDVVPDGLETARDVLAETVELILNETGLSPDRLVLGGFSQGSMVATEVALHGVATPAVLLIYSGTLLCESRWRELASKKPTLKVFQSHGRSDTILPFMAAEALHSLFVDSGLEAEFLPFSGPHTIPAEALGRTSVILAELCSSK